MNDLEKLELDKMISANNTVDHTEHIRKLKHSQKIKNNIDSILHKDDGYDSQIYYVEQTS